MRTFTSLDMEIRRLDVARPLPQGGRTGRLLMNFELMRSGFPPAIIKAQQRLEYYEALDLAHTTGKYDPFIALVAGAVEASLDLWLSVL